MYCSFLPHGLPRALLAQALIMFRALLPVLPPSVRYPCSCCWLMNCTLFLIIPLSKKTPTKYSIQNFSVLKCLTGKYYKEQHPSQSHPCPSWPHTKCCSILRKANEASQMWRRAWKIVRGEADEIIWFCHKLSFRILSLSKEEVPSE